MGVARSFQRGGHTGSNNIVMAFSPRNIVGYLLKKRLTKGGGGSRAPQDPPRYAHDTGEGPMGVRLRQISLYLRISLSKDSNLVTPKMLNDDAIVLTEEPD